MPPDKASGRGLPAWPKPSIPHTAALVEPVKIDSMAFNGTVKQIVWLIKAVRGGCVEKDS